MADASLANGVVPFTPGDPEPAGLWAVVERTDSDGVISEYLIKGPGQFGGPYWYSLDGEDGWGWDQIMRWPGTTRLVRAGVES